MVDRVTRFGVSLPKTTLDRFDRALKDMGYKNRSKAVADAVRDYIIHRSLPESAQVMATISYAFDNSTPDVNNRLSGLERSFQKNIRATMRSQMTADDCIEVLVVFGEIEDVKTLFGKISTTRGVENCQITILKNS